jgi:hypothetical protein
VDLGIPLSSASAAHVDHNEVLRGLVESGHAPPALVRTLPKMHGPDGVLASYLSPEVMRCGRGSIKPDEVLKQYDEDILTVGSARLLLWNEGFYRNSKTSELQLLFKSLDRSLIFRIDGLPGDTPNVAIYVLDRTGSDGGGPVYKDMLFPHLNTPNPNEQLMMLLSKISSQAEATLHALSMTLNA